MERRLSGKSFFFIFTVVLLFVTINSQYTQALADPIIDQPLILTESADDEYYIRTRIILDDNNKLHHFAEFNYYNGTFVLIHFVDGEIIEVDRDFYATNVFKVFKTDGGVSLFYSYQGQFYGTIVKLYKWTEQSHTSEIVYTSTYYFRQVFLAQGSESLHLMYTETAELNTTLTDLEIFENGTEKTATYVFPYELYHFDSVAILNDQLFVTFTFSEYDPINATYTTSLLVTGVTENGIYNSSIFEIEEGFVGFQLDVGEDDKFHLSINILVIIREEEMNIDNNERKWVIKNASSKELKNIEYTFISLIPLILILSISCFTIKTFSFNSSGLGLFFNEQIYMMIPIKELMLPNKLTVSCIIIVFFSIPMIR